VWRLRELRWWDWPADLLNEYIPALLSTDVMSFLERAEADPRCQAVCNAGGVR